MRIAERAAAPRPQCAEPVVVGESPALQRVLTMARRVAPGTSKVLITGESGVGKDVIARVIHANSSRAGRPFVAVNCASFSEGLLESELFGHVKGSFTGAHRDKAGTLQRAHTGTVFLDEVGEMSLRMQAMLLRFLENGEIQPVGSDVPAMCVDVRVIAATNRDLGTMVARGEFREDLLYRIRVAHLHVPPLRDRREDVRPLIAHLLAKTGQGVAISEPALTALEAHRWPGNVRELQNVVEQMVAMADGAVAGVDELPPGLEKPGISSLRPARERRRTLADALFEGLTTTQCGFWDAVYPLFMSRDLTRHDLRLLVRKGLEATGGNYRAVLRLFGMADEDYKRFLNFLASHDCSVDFREFRSPGRPVVATPRAPKRAVPPVVVPASFGEHHARAH